MTVLSTDPCCSFCRNRLQQVQRLIFLKYLKTSEKFTKFIFEKFRKFPFQKVYIKGVFSSNYLHKNRFTKLLHSRKSKSVAINLVKICSISLKTFQKRHITLQKCYHSFV